MVHPSREILWGLNIVCGRGYGLFLAFFSLAKESFLNESGTEKMVFEKMLSYTTFRVKNSTMLFGIFLGFVEQLSRVRGKCSRGTRTQDREDNPPCRSSKNRDDTQKEQQSLCISSFAKSRSGRVDPLLIWSSVYRKNPPACYPPPIRANPPACYPPPMRADLPSSKR